MSIRLSSVSSKFPSHTDEMEDVITELSRRSHDQNRLLAQLFSFYFLQGYVKKTVNKMITCNLPPGGYKYFQGTGEPIYDGRYPLQKATSDIRALPISLKTPIFWTISLIAPLKCRRKWFRLLVVLWIARLLYTTLTKFVSLRFKPRSRRH